LATTGKGGLGIDVENDFKTRYVIPSSKKQTVKQLKSKVKNADKVLLATDPDREGEAIAFHLATNLDIDLDENNRVVFNEVTKPAVVKAMENARKVDMDLVDSQETRRILDRIIGFKLSALLKSKIKSISAGRVQSVALKLIVDREDEINAFVSEEYWTITADFKYEEVDFVADLTKINNRKPEITNKEDADVIVNACNRQPFNVAEVKEEIKNKKSRPPYITSTLQQDSSVKLNFSSRKTMMVAQKLYEGINIGSAVTGLITYMRTDSNRLSQIFVNDAKEYIKQQYGDKYVGKYYVKAGKNVQDAHEAIRPTNVNNSPDSIKKYLSNDEYKLYKLIYERTLASLMADALYNSKSVKLNCGIYEYSANGRTLVFDGYLKVYPENDNDSLLPALVENQVIVPEKVEGKQHFTEPPLRYSEARLIKAMEENGIGRPSTYAMIIDTIKKRDYARLEKSSQTSKSRVFIPTEQGILTTRKLDEFFSSVINVKYTANMESQLDEIAEGKMDKLTSLNEFYNPFMELIDNAKENMEKIEPVKTGELCPECGGDLVIRKGKYGEFIACSNYPTCKYHHDIDGENDTDYGICPECGNKLVEKRGRYGKFIACSNYPECKYIVNNKKPAKETGELCPECNSPLVERVSRFGTTFVGCSSYPKCRYIVANKNKGAKPKKVSKKKDE
jgi:DNA topoisomerase-1